jgi:DNA-binding NtrC family response regulator
MEETNLSYRISSSGTCGYPEQQRFCDGANVTVTSVVRPILLVVDDEAGIVAAIDRFARRLGFDVVPHDGRRSLLAELPGLKADVAVVDLQMPDMSGIDVLRAIRSATPECQVILMTGHPSVDSAIEAVKLGALDYLSKPFSFDRLGELLGIVREGLERRRLLLAADSRLASQFEFYGMIGRSPVMQELFDSIRRLAPHVRTALITGETGTGKELVASALHRLGPRREKRLVTSNCSAIAESLSESELFGHVRGAFTGAADTKVGLFELADRGTLFLDEIAELPMPLQPKLLRAVEYGEIQRVGATDARRVDVRILAATNRTLVEEVRHGRFRQDLYYRLNVVEIVVPPLRDRRDDIPYLSASFVKEFAARFKKPIAGISAGAERLLQNAPWPGNIRELRNTLERACMLSDDSILSESALLAALSGPRCVREEAPLSPPRENGVRGPDLDRESVESALKRCGGNRSAAARELGVSRRSFYRRLQTFGLG